MKIPHVPNHLAALLERCEGYYRHGQYTDALREIETLPDIERAEPVVVAMEVR